MASSLFRQQDTAPSRSYLQLFRSGIIELVLTWEHRSANLQVYGESLENLMLESLPGYLSVQRIIGVAPPVVILISLLNVKGGIMHAGPLSSVQEPVDRDHVIAPEVLAEDLTMDLDSLLKPVFDAIWNAFGYPGSPSYDNDGRRNRRAP